MTGLGRIRLSALVLAAAIHLDINAFARTSEATGTLMQEASASLSATLREGFRKPPQEARPRVWWHWINGNITKDGIRKDIEWMQRAGIGGFHCFEAGMGSRTIVEQRLSYMSDAWQDAFRYAVGLADSLGMEVAIASCPGWSNTGGPWVKPEQAMKRLVWTETDVRGGRGKVSVTLAQPEAYVYPQQGGKPWYRDICVIAVRQRGGGDGLVRSISINDGFYRSIWAAQPAPVVKWLEVSDGEGGYSRLCDLPHGSVGWQTMNVPATRARDLRIAYSRKPPRTPQVRLHTTARIDHVEEKAGFASPPDLNDHATVATPADAVPATDVVDVTSYVDADGRLTWRAPRGDWRIIRFGYTLTGKTNHPASAEATGLEVTKLDRDAFSAFLEYYLDTYHRATGGLMGERGLRYLLIDSYEAGWETWAPVLPEEFKRRRGYSLWPWLPVLTGQIIDSAERSEEFLFDWRTTIGELITENMYTTAAETAHRRGLQTYFEAHENGRLYMADGMAVKSRADIPMAAMWTVVEGTKTDNSSTAMAESDIRESASVAHLYGKPLVACESMTVNGQAGGAYTFFPGNLKPTADLELAAGVNRFVIHESAHQPVDDKRPGLGLGIYGQWFNRHETWAEYAKAWTDYLARSCYMMQQGKNVADILYYYGEDDVVTDLFAHQHPAVPFGYNFDYLNKETLLALVSYDGTAFLTPSGSRYRVLMIDSHCQHMAPAVEQKLEQLRQRGAPVFDLRQQTFEEALRSLRPDVSADDATDLGYVHRAIEEPAAETATHIFWISNRRHERREVRATFRVAGLRPSLWQAETGKVSQAGYVMNDDGTTTVPLTLEADEAVFVVFDEPTTVRRFELPITVRTRVQRIEGPWTVQFLTEASSRKPRGQTEVMQEIILPELCSYTELAYTDIKYYSGTTVYNKRLTLAAEQFASADGSRIILSLGEVGCLAEVIVNGHSQGVVWKKPYQADVTAALHTGENTLEIRVVNQWANRIIGDQQADCPEPHTFTPVSFYRSDSPLLPAGLMGPVELLREGVQADAGEQ